jgi:protocatechuate 3,4-dioxygenase beta subunit
MLYENVSLNRRRLLQLLGGAGVLTLVGCSSGNGSSTSGTTPTTTGTTAPSTSGSSATSTTTAGGSRVEAIPEETAGPYPGDGSNGVNVLTQDGVVRKDIRSSFGSASGVAEGMPATLAFTVVDTANGGKPLAGAAVYVWHCDRDGNYSLYSRAVTNENYLRGVQETDADGVATFTSIYPACYAGRWPHIHFEVYPSITEATAAGKKLVTSQMALPAEVSDVVYTTNGYGQSVTNMAGLSLATDNVFSDGAELETPTVTGSVANGYMISLTVGV